MKGGKASTNVRPAATTIVPLQELPACLPRVARWLHAQWWHRAGVSRRGAEVLLAARVASNQALPQTWVARRGDQVVGTASLHRGSSARVPTLSGVYVLPRWRRQGVGAALCRQMATWARAQGAQALELDTEDAAAFYARLGWQAAGSAVVFFAGRPAEVTRMRLSLAPAPVAAGGAGMRRSAPSPMAASSH